MSQAKNISTIGKFFDDSSPIYEVFAYTKKSLGIHYGFWDKNTKTVAEAMENEDKVVITLGKIKSGSVVLDAGCGVGGSSIHIAQKTNAKIIGITLSPKQVSLCQKYAKQYQVDHLNTYRVLDYSKTDFKDDTFDVVYGIESICYAYPKENFLREAYRILKPGGRLVICDGFLGRKPTTPKERKIVSDFIYGYALNEMVTREQLATMVFKAGFINVNSVSKIQEVYKSVRYYWLLASIFLPFAFIFKPFHPAILAMYRNGIAAVNAYKGIKSGIADYGVISAEKPKN